MPGYELWGDEEKKEIKDVLDTGILMRYGFDGARDGKWKALEFEKAICAALGCRHAHAVSSGTAALTTALVALGVGHGDEVIIPSFTFVASFEAILNLGAVPVITDINDTLTLDPEAVGLGITSRTKCVMPVHMCGSMADMNSLLQICKEQKLLLVEDACQSFGASYKGKKLGTIGDAGAFSFDFVKTITCAEGGAVVTSHDDIYLKCDGYSDHGHDHKGADRGADLHPFCGYNFRISELHAAVGLAQIRKLDTFLTLQKRNHTLLKNILSQISEISFRHIPDPEGDSCTFLSWFLPSEDIARTVIQEFKTAGILKGNFYWYDNNWHYIRGWSHLKETTSLNTMAPDIKTAVLHHANKDFSKSDAIMGRCISTAISLLWTEEQINEMGKKMAAVIRTALSRNNVRH